LSLFQHVTLFTIPACKPSGQSLVSFTLGAGLCPKTCDYSPKFFSSAFSGFRSWLTCLSFPYLRVRFFHKLIVLYPNYNPLNPPLGKRIRHVSIHVFTFRILLSCNVSFCCEYVIVPNAFWSPASTLAALFLSSLYYSDRVMLVLNLITLFWKFCQVFEVSLLFYRTPFSLVPRSVQSPDG